MPQVLEGVHVAQQYYRGNDLDGDGARGDFAAAFDALVGAAVERSRFGEFELLRWRAGWERHYTVEVHRSPGGDRYCALAVPRDSRGWLKLWFVSDEGRVAVIRSRDDVDLATCRLVPVPELVQRVSEQEVHRRRAEQQDAARDEALRAFVAAVDAGRLDDAERQLGRLLEPPPTPEQALRLRDEVGHRWVLVVEGGDALAAQARRLLARAQEATRPSAAAALEARVLAVKRDTDPPLVLLSVGADDGVQRGTTFTILRGERRLATVVVERALRDSAGCRVVFVAEGEELRDGDRALAETTEAPDGDATDGGF